MPKQTTRTCCALLLCCVAIALLGGCTTNSLTSAEPSAQGAVSPSGTLVGQLTPVPEGLPIMFPSSDMLRAVGEYPLTGDYRYRYRDVLNNRYQGAPTTGAYAGQYAGSGLVTYDLTPGATLAGTITANGLQPNFAYQIKLQGQPTGPRRNSAGQPYSLTSKANWSNEEIGKVGRWWCVEHGNLTDGQLAGHNGHLILGYLVFDFLVTDSTGHASCPVNLDSSWHVLWKESQRTRTANDSVSKLVTVAWDPNAYEAPEFDPYRVPQVFVAGPSNVYAEWESTRGLPGSIQLAAGEYACRLLLTEESFHNDFGDTAYPDGGFWAHALSDEALTFTIAGPPPAPPTISIQSPANDASYTFGAKITFQGTAASSTGQSISSSIVWRIDGTTVYTGAKFTKSNLAVGSHIVIASVTNNGQSAEDSHTITVRKRR